ncbi:MAG: M48 family metalloprotease, partial [Pseudoxanthomonas sp.]
MNFFEHQAAARRASMRMVVLFALAVLAIVLVVDLVMALLVGPRPGALLAAALATVAVIGCGSLYRMACLREGGAAVARRLGGTEVAADTAEPSLRRLRNVVEEMAIASGVPVPRIFVLEQESGINAFAAGWAPADAAVAVSRGALERLNRDELQGVVAHEFGHALNGDMRLNVQLMGLLFGILMPTLAARKILRHGRFSARNGAPLRLAALALLAVGAIGTLCARLIKAATSRQREWLADASAAQFTGQSAGLAGALKKIGGLHEGSHLADRAGAEEASHMLFGEALGEGRWLAIHPPLLERIRRLDPLFRPEQLQQLAQRWAANPPSGPQEDLALGLATHDAPAPAVDEPPPLPAVQAQLAVSPAQVVAQTATADAVGLQLAARLLAGLPAPLRALAHAREGAA